jgi:hypothetical protein
MSNRPALDEIGITSVLVERIRRSGFVLAPVVPTRSMLEAAKESAWAEDAESVWRDMIAALTLE